MNDLEFFGMAFKAWLYLYECTVSERWNKLAISEMDTLIDVQWAELQKEYANYKKASTSSLSPGAIEEAPPAQDDMVTGA